MLTTLAVGGYRSLRDVVLPLAPLTVITGANGTGKSNLYRALRLLGACGRGRVVSALAREGGLGSALWAGPESLAGARRGSPVEGTTRSGPISLRLGFASDDLGYLVDLGLPQRGAGETAFLRDPEIKREVVFTGPVMRPATTLVRRKRAIAEAKDEGRWEDLASGLPSYRSVLTEVADPARAPELFAVRSLLRGWRFHDGFRSDDHAPARTPYVGTRTPTLADDGRDLAAAVQTIKEAGHTDLDEVIADAFEGARLGVAVHDGYFELLMHQPGMLRPLRAAELSDGTLRFILWATAMLTVDPPGLMVLNEPETSLHPSLLAPLARLIGTVAGRTQVVVVSHSDALVEALDVRPLDSDDGPGGRLLIELTKELGETRVQGLGMLTTPHWEWGSR